MSRPAPVPLHLVDPQRQGGVAAAHNEVRYLLSRIDRAFYERAAGALLDGRPSFGGV
jgi:hypothetical protein